MGENDYPVITISGAEWQAAQNAAESAQHSLQQLKAEIAALVDEFDTAKRLGEPVYAYIAGRIEILRQLSAV